MLDLRSAECAQASLHRPSQGGVRYVGRHSSVAANIDLVGNAAALPGRVGELLGLPDLASAAPSSPCASRSRSRQPHLLVLV